MRSEITSLIIFLFSVLYSNGQGFYIKPSVSYGVGLSKQELRYYGTSSYIQSKDYAEEINFGHHQVTRNSEKKEKVPLGQGKILSLDMGYESKRSIFYTLCLSYGMMDRYTATSFYQKKFITDNPLAGIRETRIESQQIVSPIWYGLEPGIGFAKKSGNYRYTIEGRLFLGFCRIRVIESEYYEGYWYNGRESFQGNGRNLVYKGSYMYGGCLKAGIERKTGENTSIGIYIEYRSQIYSPTKSISKGYENYVNFLGSAIPYSVDKPYHERDISNEARRSFLFESLSLGISIKRYLIVNSKIPNQPQ